MHIPLCPFQDWLYKGIVFQVTETRWPSSMIRYKDKPIVELGRDSGEEAKLEIICHSS